MRASAGMPIVFLLIRCVVIPCYQQSDPILDVCYQQSLKPKSTPFVCKIPHGAACTSHDCIITVHRSSTQCRLTEEVMYHLFKRHVKYAVHARVNYSLGFYCHLEVEMGD